MSYKPLFTSIGLIFISGYVYAGDVHVINQTGQDLQLVEKYISLNDNKIHYYYSECVKPVDDSSIQSLTFAGGSNTPGTNNVKSADIYEYMSADGSCSTPSDSRFWPTYYQSEPVVSFQADEFNWEDNSSALRKIHYTVLKNSQDTQAQKAAPVVVVNMGSSNAQYTSPYSLSTYGNAGALYYIPEIDDSGFLVNNAEQVSNPGAINNPFNDNVYINNTFMWGGQQWKYPTTLLIK
ncbi:hypothetical protein OAO18_02485 [Francisellaceae bacterium]|nr:hypothetical protein [Francisellaceae bacterium]